jgi:meso-butanediol dehydrogenase/(S,S)-butanediol dehydrogenase/diacetyl reductase
VESTGSSAPSRVVLVTGGSRGIGAATARRLAADGHHVAVLGRTAASVQAIAAEIGGHPIVGDASRPEDAERAVGETVETYGHLDGLVANVGAAEPGTVLTMDQADWTRDLDSNLFSAVAVSRAALPHLIDSGGTIVVIASLAGLFAPLGVAGYSTAKHAVIGLAQSMARDFGPRGVRVNVVCPGWIRTELSDRTVQQLSDRAGVRIDEGYARLGAGLPLGRVGQPEEIAGLIAFLTGPDSSFITGAVIPADGGASIIDASSLASARIRHER